jgi:hypothetical protein
VCPINIADKTTRNGHTDICNRIVVTDSDWSVLILIGRYINHGSDRADDDRSLSYEIFDELQNSVTATHNSLSLRRIEITIVLAKL